MKRYSGLRLSKEELTKVNWQVPKESFLKLKELSVLRRISINAIAVSMITTCLEKEGEIKKENDHYMMTLLGRFKKFQQDLELLGEMVSFYILQWFCYNSEIPEEKKRAVFFEGKKKHEKFMELLNERIRAGQLSFPPIKSDSNDKDGSKNSDNLNSNKSI